jgi:acetamidase/formamidase
MTRHYELHPIPEHVHWGIHDASLPPVLHVASGDTVHLTSLPAGDMSTLPPDRSLVRPAQIEALEKCTPGPATHMLTGPVHVEGAEPGDVLQIDILDISLNERWGFTAIRPLKGTLPDEFDHPAIIHPEIDIQRQTARLPWGTEIQLEPFFGIMAVAPPPHWGRVASIQPRKFGGNMDNKELRATATACRATARSASPRWKPAWPAPSA